MRFTFAPTPRSSKNHGFTLVEVLAISPLLILLVALIVVSITVMTGEALRSREHNQLVIDTQSGLDDIEADVRLATNITSVTGPLAQGQGSNNDFSGSDAFTAGSTVLILKQNSTSLHPSNLNRSLLYIANKPNPCGALQAYNTPLQHTLIYFVRNNTLMRRTIVALNSGESICNIGNDINNPGIWQRNSCNLANTGHCATTDTIITRNVSSVEFQYYSTPSQAVADNTPRDSTRFVRATINTSKIITGKAVEYTGAVLARQIQ